MSRHIPSKTDPVEMDDGQPVYNLDQLDAMDRKFVEAMLAAISAGLERAPVGIDTRPCTRRPITIASRLIEVAVRNERSNRP
jgi:hypothetical protein